MAGTMARRAPEFSTKELTKATWPDFERLFEKPGGWNFCWCMHYQRPSTLPKNEWFRTRAERGVRNRKQKRDLVDRGLSHGILVYANGEPVGWCEYGPRGELPRIDNSPRYRKLAHEGSRKKFWRIPCFVVDKKYRRRGVAGLALKAALEAIRNKGGGLVEAYPFARWIGSFGNMNWSGTVSMFQKEGFRTVAPLGKYIVVMRRTL